MYIKPKKCYNKKEKSRIRIHWELKYSLFVIVVVISLKFFWPINFEIPKPTIISNVTAEEESDINKIKPLLVDQITSRVRWRESVNYMIKKGVKNFMEVGPGKVLSGLVKKINRNVEISNINTIEDIKWLILIIKIFW